MKITSLLLLLVAPAYCGAQQYGGGTYQNMRNTACETPRMEKGMCIAIENCPPLLALLSQSPRNEAFKYLKESNCGFQGRTPQVCCPSEENRNGGSSGQVTGSGGNWQSSTPITKPSNGVGNINNHPSLRLLASPTECGKSYSQRITGGNVTDLGEYPWNIMLLFRNSWTGRKEPKCGGALINQRYVVTAAHCVYGFPSRYKLVSVVVGEHNTETDPDCKLDTESGEMECAAPKQEVGIEEAIVHPDYKSSNNKVDQFHDIAVIRLNKDIVFKGYLMNPICFPREEMLTKSYVGSVTVVAGWGKTENSSGSTVKLDVKLPVVANAECARVYQQSRVVGNNQICAGGDAGKDSCGGDSGGPLMVADRLQRVPGSDGRFYLLGIVSYGPDPCGRVGWPGVYTLVPKYASWILDQIKG